MEKFPCLELAYRALRAGGTSPAVLNAANEVVVDSFLNNGMAFHDIPEIIESVLEKHIRGEASSLETILKADAWAREQARSLARQRTS
jgi:1-deoxy-D-xylulose-5-phosphate reductoisomerase